MVTSLRYAMLMSRLINTPLLADPVKAFVVYQALCGKFGTPALPEIGFDERELELMRAERRPSPVASRFVGDAVLSEDGRGIEPFRADGGVGIITVTGSLVNRGAWLGSYSGQTSYEGIQHQLTRAGKDSRIHSVLLDMSTPGGEGNGALQTQRLVRKLASAKPVVALSNGLMASAGYFIGSGASKVVTTEDGRTGSIGVVMLHLDHSAELESLGIKPTLIYSGKHKIDGNPFESLPDGVRAEFQGEVDALRESFVHAVATARRGRTTDAQARNTEGRAFYGQEAVDAHLADEIGNFDSVLSELKRKAPRGRTRSQTMDAEARDDDVTRAEHDAAIARARTEGAAEARATGVTEGKAAGIAEAHARLDAILSDPKVKGRERFALRLAMKAPGMPTADVVDLASEQQPEPANSFANRDHETGAENVRPDPGTREQEQQQPSVSDPKSGWAAATKPIIESVTAQKQRGARAN